MIEKIIDSFKLFSERNAFYIKNKYYTYGQVAQKVSDIRNSFKQYLPELNPKYIGVIIYDDIESYSSCISVLLSGYGYVPLNPLNPVERNVEIIVQSDLKLILSSEKTIADQLKINPSVNFIFTKELPISPVDLDFPICKDEDPAYLIFTSGSTGRPKGTPISRGNLNAFLDSVWHLDWKISENDRFLQMSSMTFDMTIITFFIPLCIGACVYIVPEVEIKYFYAYKLMLEMNITVIGIVPSTLSYLEPYFPEIELPYIRYSLLGGEALPIDLANKWQHCVPNAVLINMYGPTEITVFSHTYVYQHKSQEKSHNGILALGKLVKNVKGLIVDETMQPIDTDQQGELLLTGRQLIQGYINEPDRNKNSFITISGERYYKTGDIVYKDRDNDFYFVGRLDQQVKIQGHRVELGEIEKHVRDFINFKPVVALAQKNRFGNQQIHLVVEKNEMQREEIIEYLNDKIPYYMIPSNITVIETMPINANGKIDRSKLAKLINQH